MKEYITTWHISLKVNILGLDSSRVKQQIDLDEKIYEPVTSKMTAIYSDQTS